MLFSSAELESDPLGLFAKKDLQKKFVKKGKPQTMQDVEAARRATPAIAPIIRRGLTGGQDPRMTIPDTRTPNELALKREPTLTEGYQSQPGTLEHSMKVLDAKLPNLSAKRRQYLKDALALDQQETGAPIVASQIGKLLMRARKGDFKAIAQENVQKMQKPGQFLGMGQDEPITDPMLLAAKAQREGNQAGMQYASGLMQEQEGQAVGAILDPLKKMSEESHVITARALTSIGLSQETADLIAGFSPMGLPGFAASLAEDPQGAVSGMGQMIARTFAPDASLQERVAGGMLLFGGYHGIKKLKGKVPAKDYALIEEAVKPVEQLENDPLGISTVQTGAKTSQPVVEGPIVASQKTKFKPKAEKNYQPGKTPNLKEGLVEKPLGALAKDVLAKDQKVSDAEYTKRVYEQDWESMNAQQRANFKRLRQMDAGTYKDPVPNAPAKNQNLLQQHDSGDITAGEVYERLKAKPNPTQRDLDAIAAYDRGYAEYVSNGMRMDNFAEDYMLDSLRGKPAKTQKPTQVEGKVEGKVVPKEDVGALAEKEPWRVDEELIAVSPDGRKEMRVSYRGPGKPGHSVVAGKEGGQFQVKNEQLSRDGEARASAPAATTMPATDAPPVSQQTPDRGFVPFDRLPTHELTRSEFQRGTHPRYDEVPHSASTQALKDSASKAERDAQAAFEAHGKDSAKYKAADASAAKTRRVYDLKRGGEIDEAHYNAVEQALKEGKPVPAEVLADYPDLAAKAPKTPTKQPPPTTSKETPKSDVDKLREASKGEGITFGKEGTVKAHSGLNPKALVEGMDDLDFQTGGSFTVDRGTKGGDYHFGHNLLQPLSVVDASGKTIQKGTYERIGGQFGKEASETIRGAEREMSAKTIEWKRKVESVTAFVEEARKEAKVKDKDKFTADFVDLVERDLTDPARVNATGNLKKALDLHDELTEGMRQHIIQSRKDMGIETPDDWGITDKGYYRHLFLGDVRVFVDGDFVGVARTYAEAQKAALDIVTNNRKSKLESVKTAFEMLDAKGRHPKSANITAKAREMFTGDPALRISTKRYFKLVNDLAGDVGLSMDEIMADLKGVIGRKGAKQKFLGSLLHREGYKGYSKAYGDVMSAYAGQVARTQALSKLNRTIQPFIEKFRKDGKDGLAEAVQDHMDALWGTPTKAERQFGKWIESTPVLRNIVANPTMAVRGTARRVTSVQNWLKLKYNIKSASLNLIQPLSTLWPYVKTKDFAAIYAHYMKPQTRKWLRDQGVFEGATKVEGGNATVGPRSGGGIFQKASAMNRGIGYIYGYKKALKDGLSKDLAHQNGLAWAEFVEFDNSVWNIQPALRSSGGQVFGQYKAFQGKNIQNIRTAFAKGEPARAGRIGKLATAQLAAGGIRSVSFGIKGTVSVAAAKALQSQFEAWGMGKDDAESWSDGVIYGAPSMLGADMSGSMSIVDFYGNTAAEKIVSTVFGPTVGSLLQVGQGAAEVMGAKPGNKLKEVEQGVGRLTPYVRMIRSAVDTISSSLSGKGGKTRIKVGNEQYLHLSQQESIMRALGYTPVKQSKHFLKKGQ